MTASFPLDGVRVAVTGAGGQLGQYLAVALRSAGAHTIGFGSRPAIGVDRLVDITDEFQVTTELAVAAPDCVIHAAAYTDVDGCERDPTRAEAVNAKGSAHVAQAARSLGAHLIMVSTDFIFPGSGGAPYAEAAAPEPLSVYGRSKLGGEQAVLAVNPDFAVARTAWLYGGEGKHFPRTILTLLRDRGRAEVVDDETGSPTFAGDLADALVMLSVRRASGIFHLVNAGSASRFSFARAVSGAAGFDPALVAPISTAAFLAKYPLPARRPANSTLANVRGADLGITLRPWQEAMDSYVPGLARELGIRPAASLLEEGVSPA